MTGVHGFLKSADEATLRKEFWCLAEALSTSLYGFAEKGDLGALVWTVDVEAVGIVIAGWTVLFDGVRGVIHPNGYWDTKNIPFPRDDERKFKFNGILLFAVTRPLVSIESFEMTRYQSYVL